ncbi:MAG: tRNA (adenosine(37)-N6)-dimethylallyltransferase MiaA [Lentisphaeria bacterium]|nr:tRNA (adenosine(37)-N6)-dimethylallyltransferase MiaA [Lentisphaeria bacterium]
MSGKLTVIMGPTASGKSALALRYAAENNAEIISADSMQLYRDLPIGTAQPTPEELRQIPHHLTGIYPLEERSEVFKYCELAQNALQDIWSRGKNAVLCGGTGMYLKAFLYGIDDMPADRQLRLKLDELYDSDAGEVELHARMKELDPGAYEKWKLCRRRLIRALEVFLISGKSILELQSRRAPQLRYPAEVWKLDPEPEILKKRIAARAEKMLASGWIEEAETAIAAGLFTSPTAHQALGYRQIGEYLQGSFSYDELLKKICTATWQYARRQRTWFRHQHPEAEIVSGEKRL